MKRKLVALFLIGAMVFLASCGASDKKESPFDGAGEAEEPEEVGTIEPEIEEPEQPEGDDLGEAQKADEEVKVLPPSGDYPDYPTDGVGSTPEGDPHPDNSLWFSEGAGMSVAAPKAYLDNTDKMYVFTDGGEANNGLYEFYAYLYSASHDDIMAMDDEAFAPIDELAFNLMTLYRAAPNWNVDQLRNVIALVEGVNEAPIEEVGKDGEYTIYAYVAESYPEGTPDNLKPIYDEILSQVKESSRSVTLYQPADAAADILSSLAAEAKTVTGETVNTAEIFAANKLTMVNCWASWCGPCIKEMPELEEMSKELEEKGCQIIGILMDGNTPQGLSEGLEVIEDTGVTYTNLIVWDSFNNAVNLQGYPTTFFVDQNGQIVGTPIIGAYPEGYRKALEELLSE